LVPSKPFLTANLKGFHSVAISLSHPDFRLRCVIVQSDAGKPLMPTLVKLATPRTSNFAGSPVSHPSQSFFLQKWSLQKTCFFQTK
jgi:hypothetical protein